MTTLTIGPTLDEDLAAFAAKTYQVCLIDSGGEHYGELKPLAPPTSTNRHVWPIDYKITLVGWTVWVDGQPHSSKKWAEGPQEMRRGDALELTLHLVLS